MSRYMQELCDALTRVLDRCAQLDRHRLAGYVQNVDFWVSEIQHRLLLIDGYIERRRKMVAAINAAYQHDIDKRELQYFDSIESLTTRQVTDTSTNWDELETEVNELRKQVLASTKRFVMRCVETKLIEPDQLFHIEDQLGVNLRSRKPWGDA